MVYPNKSHAHTMNKSNSDLTKMDTMPYCPASSLLISPLERVEDCLERGIQHGLITEKGRAAGVERLAIVQTWDRVCAPAVCCTRFDLALSAVLIKTNSYLHQMEPHSIVLGSSNCLRSSLSRTYPSRPTSGRSLRGKRTP